MPRVKMLRLKMSKKFDIAVLSEKMGKIRRQIKALYRTLSIPKEKQNIKGQRGSLNKLREEKERLRDLERIALKKGKITKKVPRNVVSLPSSLIRKDEPRLSLFKKVVTLSKQRGVKLKKNLTSKGSTSEFFKRQIRKLEKKPTRSGTDVYTIRGRPFTLVEEEKTPDFQDKFLMRKLIKRFSRRTGITKNIRLLYFVNEQLERQRIYRTVSGTQFNNDIFRDWLLGEEYDKDDDSLFEKGFGKRQKIVIQSASSLSPRKIAQKFLDGVNHCVFQPVINWANVQLNQLNPKKRLVQRYKKIKKLANEYIIKYAHGATIENIQEFCNKAKVNFIINDLLSMMIKNEYITIKCKDGARKTFNMINSRLNHLDVITYNGNKIELTEDDMNQLYQKCTDEKIACIFKKKENKLTWISTIDGFYMLKDENRDLINRFHDDTGINKLAISHNNPSSKIVRASYHQTGKKIFGQSTNCIRIDQEKAYANFENCSYYEGFPTLLTEYRNISLEKNETKKFLQIHLGFYKIKIHNFNNEILEKLDAYKKDICLPSPEIIYLIDLGVDLTVLHGTWGVNSIDFYFPDYILEKKLYQKIVGEWGSFRTTNSVKVHGNIEWANQLKSLGYDVTHHEQTCVGKKSDCQGCFEGCNECEDLTDNSITVPESIEIHFDRNKDKLRHMNGFAAYICSYQRIQLLQQLEHVDSNDLLGVITDEIIVSKLPTVINHGFRIKENKHYTNYSNENFLSYSINKINPPSPKAKVATIDHVNAKFQAHIGPGGSGKTYSVLDDKGYINLVYSCPSHKLRKSKLDEFSELQTEVLASLSSDKPVFYHPSVICIDEITCVSQETYDVVVKKYPCSLIIVCGDLSRDGYNYQLPCISESKSFSLREYMHVIEHTENRRAKCNKLKTLLSWYRKNVETMSEKKLIKNIKKMLASKILSEKQVKEIYKLNDYILGGHRARMKEWVDILGNKSKTKKYLVIKGNKSYDTGTVLLSDKPLAQKYLEERYSFTCHQIQGETVLGPNKIFIDINDMFQVKQMLYVALSRAEYLDQIYIIDGQKTFNKSQQNGGLRARVALSDSGLERQSPFEEEEELYFDDDDDDILD